MKNIIKTLLALIILAPIFSAQAQNPVVTQPYPVTVANNNSSTITTTDTFQSVFDAVTSVRGRAGCTLQNNGTHTMWVFYGPIAKATKGLSVALSASQSTGCNVGGITLQDQVSITGTMTDAFYAAQQ